MMIKPAKTEFGQHKKMNCCKESRMDERSNQEQPEYCGSIKEYSFKNDSNRKNVNDAVFAKFQTFKTE